MRIFRRAERAGGGLDLGPLRFEYCCLAECDSECRRRVAHERATWLLSPPVGRIG